jgi:NAD(P)-dependent dehydrogenase (short-subunit alcohol dehydrogenase family)
MGIVSKKSTVLVIAGNGGIGSELVNHLAKDISTRVYSTYRTTHPINDEVEWIQFESQNCEDYEEIISEIASKNGLHLVIDASGAFFASPILKSTPKDIARVIQTNLTAPLTLARACLKSMSPGGSLILFSSVVTESDIYGSSAYAASKKGLEKAITSLGEEFKRAGKGILGIRLGYMNYGMTFKIREDFRETIRAGLPNQEFEEIDGLLNLILDFASASKVKPSGHIVQYPDRFFV